MSNICKKCGKSTKQCMCMAGFNLEDYLLEYQRKKRNGTLTDEDIMDGVKKRKPKNKNELLSFLDAVGIDGAARDRVIKRVTKTAKKAVRQLAHDLVDDLLPREEDIVIEAQCKVECPECGEMVKDLKNHRCKT